MIALHLFITFLFFSQSNAKNLNDVFDQILVEEQNIQQKNKVQKKKPKCYSRSFANFQVTNKIEAKTTLHKISIKTPYKIDYLEVKVKKCCTLKNNSSYAFVDVYNNRIEKQIFNGWMMSALPSKNPLEDSKFDLILLNC